MSVVRLYSIGIFFFSSRRRHTRFDCDWSSDVCSSDLNVLKDAVRRARRAKVVPLADELRATDGDPHERAVAGEAEGRLREGLGRLTRMQIGRGSCRGRVEISVVAGLLKKKKKHGRGSE